MKVLLVSDCVGGVFAYTLELADALRERSVRVALALMGREPTPAQALELAARPWLDVDARPFRLVWMDAPWRDVARAGEWLLRLRDRVQPDIVQLNDLGHGVLPWHAPTVLVAHSCVPSWFQAVRGTAAPHSYDRYRERVREGVQRCDVLVAPTLAMLREFRRHHGRARCGMVVPNGIRQRLLPALRKGRFVASAGRMWDEAKNLAALDVAASGLDWPVLVAGATAAPDASEHAAAPRTLRMLGELPRARVQRLLRRAGVYAHPARYEPFGLAPLEAAVHGCALVLADLPSLREIWADAALFAPPGDPDALRAQLRRLLADDALRTDFGVRARARAAGFTAARMARGYHDRYAALLARSEAPTR
mgnify:CR=1 FL=1